MGVDGDKYYANEDKKILRAFNHKHGNYGSYMAKWYRRKGTLEDPWVSLRDHQPVNNNMMVYGGNGGAGHNKIVKNNKGANVFIRQSE